MIRKIRKNMFVFALAGAVAIGGAGVLYAQAEQKGMGMMSMMGMMQDCPMMMGMAEGPEAVLRHRESLDLTTDQVTRLETLREEVGETRQAAMERMRPMHDEIAAATGDTFDEAAVRAAFSRMADLHEDIGVTMLRARHQTSRVLTEDQREALAGLRSGRGMHGTEGMAGMGMMQMMKNCPMMRGGMGSGSAEEHRDMRHQEGGAR